MEKISFINEHCNFVPYSWCLDNDKLLPVAFKVVTKNLESLGLRDNPNIMRFNLETWTSLPESEVVAGNGDYGGIWSAVNISGARRLISYMEERNLKRNENTETRMFMVALDSPLYANSYRVKAKGVLLLEEVFKRKSFLVGSDNIGKNEK